jgi:hypothetical protein
VSRKKEDGGEGEWRKENFKRKPSGETKGENSPYAKDICFKKQSRGKHFTLFG